MQTLAAWSKPVSPFFLMASLGIDFFQVIFSVNLGPQIRS